MIGIGSAKAVFVPIVLALGMLLGMVGTPDPKPSHKPASEISLEDTFAQKKNAKLQEEKKREPIFVDWDVPKVALFFTGRQSGYIEPCGCTGLENQKGGMMRRHTLLKQLRNEKKWPTLGIDMGNQIRRFGPQANLKIATTYQCFGEDLDYSVVGLGPGDLRLSALDLYQVMRNSGFKNPQQVFSCANVTVQNAGDTSRFQVLQEGGMRIGVVMVLGDEFVSELQNNLDIKAMSVGVGLAQILPSVEQQRCNYKVLVAHTSIDRARQLAKLYSNFDLIVSCVDGEPTGVPEEIKHNRSQHRTKIIQLGEKGMYVSVVGLYDNKGKTEARFQRVPLDDRFEDSEPIKNKFLTYQTQLRALGLSELQVRPVAHPSGRKYVGSDACYDCHEDAFNVWKDGIDGNGGPHARATLDLTDPGERTWVQRHYDPECISCHVTGWNPQEFFPYESGYLKLDDKLLHGNGCENCHGPGSMHVAAENGDIDVSVEQQEAYTKEMIVTLEEARNTMCVSCHDLDNSPDFHLEGAFEKYWDAIKHYEDDE